MNVVCLAQRDPVLVAKQCATIDMLSEGRLLPAFGVGSERAPEWDAMGLGRDDPSGRTDEALEAIHRLWTEDRVDFEGKYFKLSNATISPKPAQKELPTWLGGPSNAAVRRTARFGTGWLGGAEAPHVAGEIVARVKEALEVTGRTIDNDHYGAGFPFRFGAVDDIPGLRSQMADYWSHRCLDPMIYYAIGDAATIVERIEEYVRVGIYKFILRPLSRDDDDFLVQTRRLIEEGRRWSRSAGRNRETGIERTWPGFGLEDFAFSSSLASRRSAVPSLTLFSRRIGVAAEMDRRGRLRGFGCAMPVPAGASASSQLGSFRWGFFAAAGCLAGWRHGSGSRCPLPCCWSPSRWARQALPDLWRMAYCMG